MVSIIRRSAVKQMLNWLNQLIGTLHGCVTKMNKVGINRPLVSRSAVYVCDSNSDLFSTNFYFLKAWAGCDGHKVLAQRSHEIGSFVFQSFQES